MPTTAKRQHLVVGRCAEDIFPGSERHSDRTIGSSTETGAALLKRQDDNKCRPFCYASQSLSDTEKRYAVIEKEALVATWACEKFSDCVLGSKLTLETHHRPPVPLLNSTKLCRMPSRIQRFRLRLFENCTTGSISMCRVQTTHYRRCTGTITRVRG